MYRRTIPASSKIKRNVSYEGESIEDKISRITTSKEPITDSAPMIYTERKDGVVPDYDIRTDRWEVARNGMDKVARSHRAIREQRIGEGTYDTMSAEQQGKFNEKYPGNKHAMAAKKANESKGSGEGGA